ncbi:hypothetical protein F3Y22_tig00110839pilonHSYRG00179 [Hibiscus syriacus]|uniref:Sieve element occlusion C-terminal domain-containing protein n=1 Tax=Hibiscus syriacus TaxID=106335 RepID=A0A6A2ZMM7_HIBSY|nr:hypothetical protein F3Y22_tig00110839pilonHSYRG00179 [Hibiscus syriacus]
MEEIKVLNGLYQKNENKYEILWLLIVELSVNDKSSAARIRELKKVMKWIAVEPSKIESQVVECMKDWKFIKKAIAVSVNQRGEITCFNALPMLWTWGNSAFPFTERNLWNKIDEQIACRVDQLFHELILPDDIDIQPWTKSEGTFVCLFGRGDMSWIQAFTEKVNYAAHAAGVSLKLVYLGVSKSKRKGLTRTVLSRDCDISKKDPLMLEALKVVGYGGNGVAWAMFLMGTKAMVTTSVKTALSIIENYQKWIKENVGNRFFTGTVGYNELIMRDVHSYINVNLPFMGDIPGIMMCPEFSKVMDMFYSYRCCPESLLC